MDPFEEAFNAYIRAYLPQWRYDPDGGEPEAAFLLAAKELVEDSRTRLASLPRKHEVEFLNGWELEPLEPSPMNAYAALASPEGRPVRQGTAFYLSGDGNRLWRAAEDTRAEPARLADQTLSSGKLGKLVPLPPPTKKQPTRLFDYRTGNIWRPTVQFTRPDCFASEGGCAAALALPDASGGLLDFLSDGARTAWTLLRAGGEEVPVGNPAAADGELLFKLPAAPEAVGLRASARPGCVPPGDSAGAAYVRTERTALPPNLVWNNAGVCPAGTWLPFGDAPDVWETCYLSCPDALALRGARMTVSFTLSFRTKEELLPGMDQEPEYRPVMRRMPAPPPPVREIRVNRAVWEYWNGSAWFPLPGTEAYTGCFDRQEEEPVQIEARFAWPEDAAPCETGGMTGHWLRWRVARADGGGWLPRRFYAPEVTGLTFSATLENAPAAISARGALTDGFQPAAEPYAPLFPALEPGGDCWWLGFDRPPGGTTLRLYLSLQERVPGGTLSAWEAMDGGGEHPLALEDGTDGFAHSGILTLHDVRGGKALRFQARRWWLCLRDESGRLALGRRFPQLENLACGAVRLTAEGEGDCLAGEPLAPLRGGALSGATLTGGFGGAGRESDAACLSRAKAMRHCLGRGVSALDIDQLICGKFRDVLRTCCVPDGGAVRIGILMRDPAHHEAAFAGRREQILRLVKQASVLPALGKRIELQEASFYLMGAMVWLRPAEDVPARDIRLAVQEALDRFLNPATGNFQGDGWQFGALPTWGETRNFLQANVPGAAFMKLLLTAVAPDGRELEPDRIQDAFALPLPGSYTVHMMRGEEPAWNP